MEMAAKLGPLSFQSQKYYFMTPSSAALPLMVTTSSVGSPRSTFMASSTLHSSTATSTRKQADKNLKRSSIGRNYEAVEVVPNNKSCVLVEKMEVIKAMEDWAEKNILIHLKPVDKCWQPQDFLPDSCCYKDHSDGRLLFLEQIKELRERTKEIPDDYFVVLVGDMITEEALPTYQTRFNCMQGIWDDTGVSTSPWAVWSRAWTAEENRHGDLLNKYLYLSGRVDMKQVEKTIQYLIGTGMDIGTENDPYKWFIYTSFQERATFIAHGNTARLAMKHGDRSLAQICGLIASDEKRHEIAYTKVVEKLFEMDPDNTVVAFADMMRKRITMPAHLLYDGRDDTLFQHFSAVASRIGVYTALDYIHILEHLVEKWNVPKLTGLSAEGRKAQDYVCRLAPRLLLIKERAQQMAKLQERPPISTVTFSWIFDKQVNL